MTKVMEGKMTLNILNIVNKKFSPITLYIAG